MRPGVKWLMNFLAAGRPDLHIASLLFKLLRSHEAKLSVPQVTYLNVPASAARYITISCPTEAQA